MKTTYILERLIKSGSPDVIGDCLSIGVIYSDETAASKAMEFHWRVLRQFGPECPVRHAWWDMASLDETEGFESSLSQAAAVDILFVAITSPGELSLAFKTWLARVLATSLTRNRAMVVLLGTTDENPAWPVMVDGFLREQARLAGTDYFVHSYVFTPAAKAGFPEAVYSLPRRDVGTSGVERWGINQ